MNIIRILLPLSILLITLISCREELPLDKDLKKKSYSLTNQDSIEVIFPEIVLGHIALIGFIYTHCPDICPMTTHNMYLTEKRLKEQDIDDVKFVGITFDPDRDTPEVLTKFAEIRDISFKNWMLLTGKKEIIEDLLRRFDVKAIKTDQTVDEKGNPEYSMMHTDRISLVDENGILKKNYKGSTLNLEEIIEDIKTLKD